MANICTASCKVSVIFSHINYNLKVLTYFSKLANIYFHENPYAISRTVPDAQADARL